MTFLLLTFMNETLCSDVLLLRVLIVLVPHSTDRFGRSKSIFPCKPWELTVLHWMLVGTN